MKKNPQFIPLLKQMLGFYRYSPWLLLIYIVSTSAVLLASSVYIPGGWMRIHAQQTLWAEQAFWAGAMGSIFCLMVATPLPFQLFGGSMSLEFLFTRAVDRGVWLRTERVAVIIIALSPFLLNLLFAPLGPKLTFEPAAPRSTAAAVQERYAKVFPGTHLSGDHSSTQSEELVIYHGSEMFAAWLLWCGLVALFLTGAYFSLIFKAWQRAGWHHSKSRLRPWLGTAMVYAPMGGGICLFFLCIGLHVNLAEECFLGFAAHPIPMTMGLVVFMIMAQRCSERIITELEFEFV